MTMTRLDAEQMINATLLWERDTEACIRHALVTLENGGEIGPEGGFTGACAAVALAHTYGRTFDARTSPPHFAALSEWMEQESNVDYLDCVFENDAMA